MKKFQLYVSNEIGLKIQTVYVQNIGKIRKSDEIKRELGYVLRATAKRSGGGEQGAVIEANTPDPCAWDNGNPDCEVNVSSGDIPGFVDASTSSVNVFRLLGHREQLPKCLRDFLRPYFGNMQLGNWNPISPVDDARFISGLPVYVPSDKVAITLGLYDIHYNATKVSLTSRDSIGVIAEEIAHTVQFIKIWEKVEADHGINYSYQKAQAAWGIAYFGNSAKIGAKNLVKGIVEQVLPSGIVLPKEDEYRDNNYEKEAIAIRGKVEESLKLLDRGPCD